MLSNFISLIFWYNNLKILTFIFNVVICFQILYLWYSDTTKGLQIVVIDQLWFAFKFYIFDILIQLNRLCNEVLQRCDLLSNFISLIFWYNAKQNPRKNNRVVICFQILYLWYSDTTLRGQKTDLSQLWFAFKFYIFDILIQHSTFSPDLVSCCDLLSNFISLIFWYNKRWNVEGTLGVVICFQILYLWYSDTTHQCFELLLL